MLYFHLPLACPVTLSDFGRAVCIITPWPDQAPDLTEVSYADALTSADFAEALTFIALAAILVYCGLRVVARGLRLRRARRDSVLLFARIADALYLNNRAEAFCLLSSSSEIPLARVVCAGLDAARVGKQMECSDGGVSWARNLATYIETVEWRRGLWELNVAACIAPVIAMLFCCYVIDRIVSGSVPTVDGLAQALEALAFSVCVAAAAFSMYLWLSSAADELCQSLDRFSTGIVERLLNPVSRSATADWLPQASHARTMPLAARRTRPLVDRSPFVLLQLSD
jgi:hypothetical protein